MGSIVDEIRGLVENPVETAKRIFIGVGVTGLVRAEWMRARYAYSSLATGPKCSSPCDGRFAM